MVIIILLLLGNTFKTLASTYMYHIFIEGGNSLASSKTIMLWDKNIPSIDHTYK